MSGQKQKYFTISLILFCLSFIAVYSGVFRLPLWGSDPNFIADRFFYCVINTVFWFTGAYLLSGIIQKVLWSNIFRIPAGSRTIGRIEDFAITLVYMSASGIVFAVVFKQQLTLSWVGIFFALLAIITFIRPGLLKSSGTSFINAARPFKISDRIKLINSNGNYTVKGEVIGFDRKTIRLKTDEDTMLLFPSSLLDKFIIENIKGLNDEVQLNVLFTLNKGISHTRARRILAAASKEALLILDEVGYKAPEIRINKIAEGKIEYKISYRIIPWKTATPEKANDVIISKILDHLKIAGIDPDGELNKQDIIKKVFIFDSLPDEERQKLSSSAKANYFKEGRTIINQGDKGNSMYVLAEGLLSVFINSEIKDKDAIKVGLITPGQFFGEMSLFTGEDRSATIIADADSIVYEITKDALKPIIERKPALAVEFGSIIAERQSANLQKLEDFKNRKDSFIEKVIIKIKSYFEIGQ